MQYPPPTSAPPPPKPTLSILADLLAEAAQACTTPRDPEVLRLRVVHVQGIAASIINHLPPTKQ